MELRDALFSVAERITSIESLLETEEATKTALVMPFIQALGYDIFNPIEVVPEFTADVGIKRGEKIDYAVIHDGQPIILIECKKLGTPLDAHSSQLFRYFGTTPSRVGILTDGVEYRFYADLERPNCMDLNPFLTMRISRPSENAIAVLEKLTKSRLDLDGLIEDANAMRHRTQLRLRIDAEFQNPSDEFVRLLVDPIHRGRMTQGVLDHYRPLVQQSLRDTIASRVEDRLKQAIAASSPSDPRDDAGTSSSAQVPVQDDEAVCTTIDEIAGYYIVKTILRDLVDPERITARDVLSYFSVLLDDNNRKPICRLWMNGNHRFLGVFDAEKNEDRLDISKPEDIFRHAERLRDSLTCTLAR